MTDQTFETERDVLRAALEMHAQNDAPSTWDVLEIQIRTMCARAGLPRPDLKHFPPSETADAYFASLDGGAVG